MEGKTYFSYLLRIWRVVRGGKPVWMASLDEPHTDKRHSFTSLQSLFAFLLQHTLDVDNLTQPQAGPPNQNHPSDRDG
jgi:hypothetical protein